MNKQGFLSRLWIDKNKNYYVSTSRDIIKIFGSNIDENYVKNASRVVNDAGIYIFDDIEILIRQYSVNGKNVKCAFINFDGDVLVIPERGQIRQPMVKDIKGRGYYIATNKKIWADKDMRTQSNVRANCPFGLPVPKGCKEVGDKIVNMDPDKPNENRRILEEIENKHKCTYASYIGSNAVVCNYGEPASVSLEFNGGSPIYPKWWQGFNTFWLGHGLQDMDSPRGWFSYWEQ